MFRIFAHHHNALFAARYFAVLADFTNGCANFHSMYEKGTTGAVISSPRRPVSSWDSTTTVVLYKR